MNRISLARALAMPMMSFLTGLAAPSVSSACSRVVRPISVGSNFKVKVSGYDGPVKVLLLNVTDGQGRAQSAVTDDNGIAYFRDVPPGTQYLRADHDNGYAEQLDAKPSGRANATVPMRWPSIEPIHVRSISGMMRSPDAAPGQLEQRVLSLELLEGISGQVLFNINTTDRGEFDFGKLLPGLYFIHLKPFSAFHQQMEGLIGIVVDPAAPARADKLDLNVVWTSCGLSYIDLLHCPQLDLHVTKLEGHAIDSMGRGLRGLQIVLLDLKQNQVAHGTTDTQGDFSFPAPLGGSFDLRIEGTGITPVHTLLDIDPNATNSSLDIEAGYGRCTAVRAK